jgi:prepilin-type processing-associated H-X9-DG protein
VLYGTNFLASMIMHPSSFVFLSDVRAHASEMPFYGSNPANEVGCTHCWAAQISSRHNAGANINFADGHVAYFKYTYICSNKGTSAGDAAEPDINWTYNGVPIQ